MKNWNEENPIKKCLPYVVGILALAVIGGGGWYGYQEMKVAKFREKFTFNNVMELLRSPRNPSYAEKCGLSIVYQDQFTEEGYGDGDSITSYDYAYGYEVEKGSKDEPMGYKIGATSAHSCYFRYISASDVCENFYFKNKSDADYFFEMAKDYGLIKCDNAYYIPKKKVGKGITVLKDYAPLEDAMFGIQAPSYEDGWYCVSLYPYFLP